MAGFSIALLEARPCVEGARPALLQDRLALAALVGPPGLQQLGGAVAAALALRTRVGRRGRPEAHVDIRVRHLGGVADHDDSASVDEGGAVAEAAHRAHVVRHEQDRLALVAQAVEHVEALLLEAHVADGQHLVDQQDVGVHLDHHGEREPHLHARGVVLELQLLELAQLGEVDDVVIACARLVGREAEHDAVHQDVVAGREVRVEAHAQLDERREAPVDVDGARVGAVDARHALQQRALARAVAADDPEELAALDRERHVVERVEAVVADPPERVQGAFLQGRDALLGNLERLRDPVDCHRRDGVGHFRHAGNRKEGRPSDTQEPLRRRTGPAGTGPRQAL